MKAADAPPPGWYPDPNGGSRLRWWEGTDWSDRYRAPPSPAEKILIAQRSGEKAASSPGPASREREPVRLSRTDTEEIISQVRQAARSEIDRAADVFTQRARAATRQIQPLVSQYTNRIVRWLQFIALIVAVLVISWFLFQAFAQQTFFDWLGERIDNLQDEDGAGLRLFRGGVG